MGRLVGVHVAHSVWRALMGAVTAFQAVTAGATDSVLAAVQPVMSRIFTEGVPVVAGFAVAMVLVRRFLLS